MVALQWRLGEPLGVLVEVEVDELAATRRIRNLASAGRHNSSEVAFGAVLLFF